MPVARIFVPILIILLVPGFAGCLTDDGPGTDAGPVAIVVAQHHLATDAGAAILGGGGNAIDAAAAVQWALNVVEPQFSGIGGGAFIVYYDAADGTVTTLDGRETAPAGTTGDMHQYTSTWVDPTLMGTAVGVPGTLRLYEEALRRWGTLGLAETLAPAIDLAQEGWQVSAQFAADIERFRHRIESWPEAAEWLLPGSVCLPVQTAYGVTGTAVARCQGGAPPNVGATLTNPELAATFRLIAEFGPEVFYSGPIADAIVATQAEREGRMTWADLESYEVVERAPSISQWREHEVYTMDMPSSALTFQQMLKLLEGDDLALSGHGQADTLHLMIEAMRLSYADRAAYMGDEDHVEVPKQGLLHPVYIAERRLLIGPGQANADIRPGDPWPHDEPATQQTPIRQTLLATPLPEGHHTSHFVVVDHAGNIASVTTTIEHYFGSGMLVPGYGFFLNNELTDFDWTPGGPNEAAPHKRPRSSMSPTIVFNGGEPVFTLGSPGGATIITSVYQVFLNVLEHGMPLEQAVAAPRIYGPVYPEVAWEEGVGKVVRDDLEQRGHKMNAAPGVIGSVQAAIRGPDGQWIGAADPRREGSVVYVPLAGIAG